MRKDNRALMGRGGKEKRGKTVEIYGDIYMLINALCDFPVLFLTACLLRRKVKKRRLFLGALIGGCYALLYLYIAGRFLLSAFLAFLFSMLMVFAVFSFGNFRFFLRALICFFVVSLLMGGAVTALHRFLLKTLPSPLAAQGILLLFLSLSAFGALLGGKILESRCRVRDVELNFTVNAETFQISGLVDSGNLLTDSETGLCVIILSPEIFKKGAPRCERLLPLRTVTSEASFPCFLAEKLCVNGRECKALLAIAPDPHSFGGAQALVPEALLL